MLEAALAAPVSVVGRILEPSSVDLHGRSARVQVERVVAGKLDGSSPLRIGWEELSPGRPSRFQQGDRVLLVLEPLPDASLWQQRFPEGGVLVVAARGQGFLRDPSARTLELLEGFLSLPSEDRDSPRAASWLAKLVAEAEAGLAQQALRRLARIRDESWKQPGSPALGALANALGNDQRPALLRGDLLDLIASAGLKGLREPCLALAVTGSPFEADAIETLARLDGRLEPVQVRALLARRGDPVRAVAVRYAGDVLDTLALVRLLREDPDPKVRIAALEALTEGRGDRALRAAGQALFDEEAAVRVQAAQRIGRHGAAVVSWLRDLTLERQLPLAGGPLAALRFAGAPGLEALFEIAHSHPDERVRKLALLLLGGSQPAPLTGGGVPRLDDAGVVHR